MSHYPGHPKYGKQYCVQCSGIMPPGDKGRSIRRATKGRLYFCSAACRRGYMRDRDMAISAVRAIIRLTTSLASLGSAHT
jgi:hypothetical protein